VAEDNRRVIQARPRGLDNPAGRQAVKAAGWTPGRKWLWLGFVAAGVVYVIAVYWAGGPTRVDAGQVSSQIAAVASGHLGRAFPTSAGSATPPGFALLAGTLARVGLPVAIVGVACGVVLAAAATALAAAVNPILTAPRRVAVFAAVLALPAVWNALLGYFHPQDLLAMALVCLALRAVSRGAWCAAGAWLGAAFVTKQWAALAAVAVVAFVPSLRAGRRFVVGGMGALAVLFGPFVADDPSGTWRAVRAADVGRSEIALVAHLRLPGQTIDLLGRAGPLAVALLLAACVAASRLKAARHVGRTAARATGTAPAARSAPTSTSQPVFLALACIACRLLFDPAVFGYYLLPASVLLVVATAANRQFPIIPAAWAILTADLLAVPGHSTYAALVDAVALFTAVSAVVVFAGHAAIQPHPRYAAACALGA
jgi:hypothetical protein